MIRGKLLILSAPSGAGKSSLAKALAASVPNVAVSVSHTTRAPRPGERQGADYFFVSADQFATMVKNACFLEHARVFDNHYGTARESVENLLFAGENVVLDIDWQGARRIKELMPDAVTVFVLPPSREALRERLVAVARTVP
ncbi:MAG: guanylate kinase, partial [Acidiferrobacterales bacterium]